MIMKQLLAIFFIAVLVGCTKEAVETTDDDNLVDLHFTATNTQPVQSENGNIVSRVQCSAPNLCYKLVRFNIKETAPRQYEIRAKGSYPEGNPVCAQAIYQVDSTVSINAPARGQYILRFYRNQSLFKADTVQVN
jgi:hypothetical protein